MKRKAIVSILLALVLLLMLNCRNTETVCVKPTEKQIKKFIDDNKLDPLAVKTIGKSFTVILYETSTEKGYYSIRTDTKGMKYEDQRVIPTDFINSPIFTTGVFSGTPFVTVILEDEKIRKEANMIEVEFVNGDTVYAAADGSKGYIIVDEKAPLKGEGRYFEVTIYDKDKNILFPK